MLDGKTAKLAIFPSTALWLLLMLNSCAATTTVWGTSPGEKTLNLAVSNQSDQLHKAEVLAQLASAAAATGNVKQAQEIFDKALQAAQTIDNQSLKVKTISAIAVKLAEAGQTQRALQVFDQAVNLAEKRVEYYDKDEALRDIVVQVAQVGEQQRALQWAQKIASGYRKAEALNGIAAAEAAGGKLEQAKGTLLKALESARGVTGDYAYESNGSCANYKFEAMSQIAGNLAVVEQLKTALQVAQSISGCVSAAGESRQDYQAWAFLGILGHLTKVSQVTQTLEAAKPIANNHLEKAEILSAIGVKLAKMGESQLALQVAKTLGDEIQLGTSLPEVGAKDKALRDIATELLAVGQTEAALQVAQSIPDEKVKGLALADVAQQLAKAGQVERALQMANSISDGEGKALGLMAIASELNAAGQLLRSQQLLSQLPLPTIPDPNVFGAYQPLRRIAAALAKIGQFDQALQVAETIKEPTKDKYTKSEALADIAKYLAESGKLEQAFQVAQTIETSNSKAETLATIIPKLTEISQVEQALQVTQTIQVDGWKDTPLAQIAPKLVELGQTERGIKIAQTLREESTKNEVLANIADQLAKSQKTEQALLVAQSIQDNATKANTLAGIAAQLIKSNEPK